MNFQLSNTNIGRDNIIMLLGNPGGDSHLRHKDPLSIKVLIK